MHKQISYYFYSLIFQQSIQESIYLFILQSYRLVVSHHQTSINSLQRTKTDDGNSRFRLFVLETLVVISFDLISFICYWRFNFYYLKVKLWLYDAIYY